MLIREPKNIKENLRVGLGTILNRGDKGYELGRGTKEEG